MYTKRHIFLFVLFLALTASAQDNINALKLHFVSGRQVTVLLDSEPVITFSGSQLVLSTHMNVVSYNASDISKYTYASVVPSGITNPNAGDTMFTFTESSIIATHLAPGSAVEVYSVDGALVASGKADVHGNATIGVPARSGAVYVVKTSVVNFKITKP